MTHAKKDIGELKTMAARMRRTALDMALSSGDKGAHLGGSLSCIEIYAVLYGRILQFDVDDHEWNGRDRLIAGKEHARLAEYPALYETGFLTKENLFSFEQDGGLLAGHPYNVESGLEYSSCSLGTALSYAVGVAVGAKRHEEAFRVYVVMGDGECHEGAVWEAAMTAAHYRLDNLTTIIDRNGLSADGNTEHVMALDDLAGKWRSFGWAVRECDGHSIESLVEAFSQGEKERPNMIIAHTVKGNGISFMENNAEWHRKFLTMDLYRKAVAELNGDDLPQ